MTDEFDGGTLQTVDPKTFEVMVRAETDVMIETAKKYPRSMALFKKRALEMVSLDEETAASCIFRRPVGKKYDKETGQWKQEFAEGMSVRMAEIVMCCYGNLKVGAKLIDQTPRYVKAMGQATDLETVVLSQADIIESTVDSNGEPYKERMRIVVAKAALAKARRDAIFQVVPRALCKHLEEVARQIAVGDATTLQRRRAQVMKWLGSIGVDPARVFRALGIKGEDDIGLEELATLTGLKTSIKEKDVTIDEAFPPLDGDAGGIRKPQPKNPAPEGGQSTTGDASGSASQGTTPEAGKPAADPNAESVAQNAPPKDPPAPATTPVVETQNGDAAGPRATPGVLGMIRKKAEALGYDDAALCMEHGLEKLDGISAAKGTIVLNWLKAKEGVQDAKK